MKNRGITFLLLLVVGIVWYKVFVRFTDDIQSNPPQESTSIGSSPIHLSKPAHVQLNANYRDPFTGKFSELKVKTEERPAVSKAPVARREVYWPTIRYHGLIRKKGAIKSLAIVSIDGQYFQLKQGEAVLDDILLKSVQRDSIILEYHKIKRVFRR